MSAIELLDQPSVVQKMPHAKLALADPLARGLTQSPGVAGISKEPGEPPTELLRTGRVLEQDPTDADHDLLLDSAPRAGQ